MINNNIMEKIEYSEISYKLTKEISKEEKKNGGIYFTPPETIRKNIEIIKRKIGDKKIENILEPSCGSGEYIRELKREFGKVRIRGIEKNETIYRRVKEMEDEEIKIENEDFIEMETNERYDLIIGNPPYVVINKSNYDDKKMKKIKRKYGKYYDGRCNLFVLFIAKSMELLKEGGIISFILPKSFINCIYYEKMREYIIKNYRILSIRECEDEYIETKQETIMMIIENNKENKENNKYIMSIDGNNIIGSIKKIKKLKELYKGAKTLKELNYSVNVGNIVWNQCKEELTEDETETLLIYSSDIKEGKIKIKKYDNEKKKNYIRREGMKEICMVINRGYGVGEYKLEYCIVDIEKEYLIENHLIVIKNNEEISREDKKKRYEKIVESLKDERTKEFIKIYFGNNAINTVELNNIMPIYNYEI